MARPLPRRTQTQNSRQRAITSEDFDDSNMAKKVAREALQGNYVYIDRYSWMVFTGTHYERCDVAQPLETLRQYFVERFQIAADIWSNNPNPNTLADMKGWQRFLSGNTQKRIVDMTRGIKGILKRFNDFDNDPDLLNTPSGILDLRTKTLRPHDPKGKDLFTHITNVPYDPNATHPDWDAALEAIPQDVQQWAQMRYGQAITGYPPKDDRVIIEYGTGANGKSTLVDAFTAALGTYYRLISPKVLLASDNDTPTETMDLKGLRWAQLEETPEARRLDMAKIKKAVGTTQITARPLFRESQTFYATHSLFITTNYRPVVLETDTGTWRRLTLFVFPYTFTEDPRLPLDKPTDPHIKERVGRDTNVHMATLRWLVDGAYRWYQNDKLFPNLPHTIVNDTEEWREASDLVYAFISERMAFDQHSVVSSKELLQELNSWLNQQGHRSWSAETVASKFKTHKYMLSNGVEKGRKRYRSVTSHSEYFEDTTIAPNAVVNVFTGIKFRQYKDA